LSIFLSLSSASMGFKTFSKRKKPRTQQTQVNQEILSQAVHLQIKLRFLLKRASSKIPTGMKEIKLNKNKWREHTMQNGTSPNQSNDHGISPVRNNLTSVTLYLQKTRKKINHKRISNLLKEQSHSSKDICYETSPQAHPRLVRNL